MAGVVLFVFNNNKKTSALVYPIALNVPWWGSFFVFGSWRRHWHFEKSIMSEMTVWHMEKIFNGNFKDRVAWLDGTFSEQAHPSKDMRLSSSQNRSIFRPKQPKWNWGEDNHAVVSMRPPNFTPRNTVVDTAVVYVTLHTKLTVAWASTT
jgi:hypothetical protein